MPCAYGPAFSLESWYIMNDQQSSVKESISGIFRHHCIRSIRSIRSIHRLTQPHLVRAPLQWTPTLPVPWFPRTYRERPGERSPLVRELGWNLDGRWGTSFPKKMRLQKLENEADRWYPWLLTHCWHSYLPIYTHIIWFMYACVCVYAYVYEWVCIYTYICVCMYIYIYVYKYNFHGCPHLETVFVLPQGCIPWWSAMALSFLTVPPLQVGQPWVRLVNGLILSFLSMD